MILSDSAILKAIDSKEIVIKPFRRECLGSNSYDVHLGDMIGIYEDEVLDSKKDTPCNYYYLNEEGFTLQPGRVYLASTEEYTESTTHVPFLDGKSSIGRLGLFIHATAGRGDVGFKNFWTLELVPTQPVKIYKGMKIGQLFFYVTDGEVMTTYDKKKDAKYTKVDSKPQPSQMYMNFEDDK